MGSHDLLLLHASRAAIDPVAEYYLREAPELRPVNLLDEGVMGMLRRGDEAGAVSRLARWASEARDAYGVRGGVVTCSALSPAAMKSLRTQSPVPLIKIDEPMLGAAAEQGGRIGLVATFAATVETSEAWLRRLNPGAEIVTVCDTEALERLLAGDRETHDARLLGAVDRAAGQGAGHLVLAQVSMARLAGEITARTGLVARESLSTSLVAARGLWPRDPAGDKL